MVPVTNVYELLEKIGKSLKAFFHDGKRILKLTVEPDAEMLDPKELLEIYAGRMRFIKPL